MGLIIFLVVYPVLMCWDGLVLHLLWNWFMVPALDIGYAIGVSLTLNMFITSSNVAKKDADPGRTIVLAVLRPLMALGVGAAIHAIIG